MSRPSRLRELKEQAWNAVVRAEGHVQSAHSRLDQLQKAVQGIKRIDPHAVDRIDGSEPSGGPHQPSMSLLGGAIWHKWYEGCKLLIENGCGVEHPVFEGRFLDQHLLKEAWVCDTGDLAGDVFGNEILQEHFDSMMQLVAAIEQARDGRRTYN